MEEKSNNIERSTKAELLTRERKAEYWTAVIADWELSGLTQRKYCEGNAIAFLRFKYWRGQLSHRSTHQGGETNRESAFIPISIKASSLSIRLDTPSGYSMSFSELIDPKRLAQILSILREAG